jgi:hypothetical protein
MQAVATVTLCESLVELLPSKLFELQSKGQSSRALGQIGARVRDVEDDYFAWLHGEIPRTKEPKNQKANLS